MSEMYIIMTYYYSKDIEIYRILDSVYCSLYRIERMMQSSELFINRSSDWRLL